MTPARWEQIREIFGRAMELSGAERRDFVLRTAGGCNSLCEEVFRLLDSHDRPVPLIDLLETIAVGWTLPAGCFREGQLVSGRFHITSFRGEGGMGAVYAAEDQELHTLVAIKTLHPHMATSPKFAEHFRREVHLARQVSHPNVCRIFDAGRHEGTLYLTMELLEGETLARRLERSGRFAPEEAIPIIRQLCEGLGAAHRAGVVHCDFKPGNVMLVGSRAVVTDFGLARLIDSGAGGAATTRVAVGTPDYMAPEQIEGGSAGIASDIYALGVVMFEMVTGRKPYESASSLARAARKLIEPPPRPAHVASDIPPNLEAAIVKCLAAKPEDRFAQVEMISRVIDGEVTANVRRKLPLRKFGLAMLGALVLLAALVGLRGLIRHRRFAPSAEAVRWYRQGVDALAEDAFLKAANLLERAVSIDERFIAAHARLAEAYAELDMGDKAKDQVIRAATIAPDRSSLSPAEARLLEAAQFMVSREFEKAERTYQAIARDSGQDEDGRAQLGLGRAAEKANDTSKAMEAYTNAAKSSSRREAALMHLGRLNARLGNRAQAAEQLTEAEKLFTLASNHEGITEVKLVHARLLESSDLPQAEVLVRAGINLAGLTGNRQQQIKSRFALSRVKLLQGHVGEANAIAEEAIAHAESLHLENLSVQGLNDMAAVFTRQMKWIDVQAVCLRAVELAKRTRSRAGEAVALFYLAQARANTGDHDAALESLKQAAVFYREGSDSLVLQNILALQAALLCMQGRYGEAKADAAEMQKWAEAHGDLQTLILALQRGAEPRVFEGDYPAALGIYAREAELQRRSGRLAGTAYALINQGDMLWRLGRYQESAARLEDAHKILQQLRDGSTAPLKRLSLVRAHALLSQLRPREARLQARAAASISRPGIRPQSAGSTSCTWAGAGQERPGARRPAVV